MDINFVLALVGLAVAVVGGVGGVIINLSSKISKLEGRLEILTSDNRLREQVDRIQSESIQKLQQWATDLNSSTQAQLDHLAKEIAEQERQVQASLQILKKQEASSLGTMEGRAQQLVQHIHEIEQRVQQVRTTIETELSRLTTEIAQQQEQVSAKMEALNQQETALWAEMADKLQHMKQIQQIKQDIEQEVKMIRQTGLSTRLISLETQIGKLQGITYSPEKLWWLQLSHSWKVIFREAIGVKSEPIENESKKISDLVKDYSEKKFSSLDTLKNLTGLQSSESSQWKMILKEVIGIRSADPSEEELIKIFSLTQLKCNSKKLTHLEPLRALAGLQILDCSENQLTSLEPLHSLKQLQKLFCRNISSLSQEEIERFKQAVPSCLVEGGSSNATAKPNIFIKE